MDLPSRRPYLLRAMHEWIIACDHSPHLVVDATFDGVVVPSEHINDGTIVLNADRSATQNLTLGNHRVEFDARFHGQHQHVVVPMAAIQGIYAKETGVGMVFNDEDYTPPDSTPPVEKRPSLKVVR